MRIVNCDAVLHAFFKLMTIAELISKGGTDTFFCPASALAGFIILMVNAGTI